MAKLLRLILVAVLIYAVIMVGVLSIGHITSGGSSSSLSAQSAPTPSTTTGQAASRPTIDPRTTVLLFMEAVELGDRDIVSELTGASAQTWCSKGLTSFIGYTDFWPLTQDGGRPTSMSTLPSNASGDVNGANHLKWMIKTYDNGKKACIHVDSFMRFVDPGALPSTRCITHYYIDGDFKLEAAGTGWIITSLPNYQGARNDGPWKWGTSPYVYPYPGDALGPYLYPPGHEPHR